jgi:hypothetical protein
LLLKEDIEIFCEDWGKVIYKILGKNRKNSVGDGFIFCALNKYFKSFHLFFCKKLKAFSQH